MSSRSLLATAVPLASLTAVGMLATDLYLPAVPALPEHLGGTLEGSQMTLASFTGALAVSQLFWGWASDRFGEDLILRIGTLLLLGASLLCALSPSMEILILGRTVQGLGAGAATAVVPALLRRTFNEADAVKAISIVGSTEAIVPALGPVLGALLISITSWRASFWILAALSTAVLPFQARITRRLPKAEPLRESPWASAAALCADSSFLKHALAYATMFAALIVFVFSSPQVISKSLGLPIQIFSLLQVLGVATFIAGASQGGKLVARLGIRQVALAGAWIQLAGAGALLALGFLVAPPFGLIVLFWSIFCVGLGFRGPTLMAKSLESAGPRSGQASGLLMFLSFGAASAGTAAVAPFLVHGLISAALGLFLLTLMSALLTK